MDDPYSPYYPGDDYVDWIGLSALYRGPFPLPLTFSNATVTDSTNEDLIMSSTSTPTSVSPSSTSSSTPILWNVLAPNTTDNNGVKQPFSISLDEQLTGGMSNLYYQYAVQKMKPLILWNAGAAYYVNENGVDEETLKMNWLGQFLESFMIDVLSLFIHFIKT